MPVYTYECSRCHKREDHIRTIAKRDVPATCDCGAPSSRVPITSFNTEIWAPITLEHIADKPMTFTTKKSLIRHCNENNLQSGALL